MRRASGRGPFGRGIGSGRDSGCGRFGNGIDTSCGLYPGRFERGINKSWGLGLGRFERGIDTSCGFDPGGSGTESAPAETPVAGDSGAASILIAESSQSWDGAALPHSEKI